MNIEAGTLDRRIRIQEASEPRDAAGDVLEGEWSAPAGWPNEGKRWARKVTVARGVNPIRGSEIPPGVAQELLREADTIFILRWDSLSTTIAAETMRVMHRERAYRIVAKVDTNDRADGVILLCSSRPDMRGDAGPVDAQS